MLAAYAAFLLYFRPLHPFEWDEVLFMRAAERFDVAEYAPHAPGYPAYVAAVKAVGTLAPDPQLANQLTVIVAAVALLAALAALVRRLGGGAGEAAAAMVTLGVTPAFAFNANVGLSDVPGAALGVAAVLALALAWERPRWAWLAAAAAALAVGARPQVILALLPAGAALLVRLALSRRWGALAAALGTGTAASAACWLPAVLITGVDRYFAAADVLRTYVRVEELGYRLPRAPLPEAAEFWLGRPFGAPAAAVAFWLLAASGAWWWWRTGRRRLALVAGSAAASYLVLGAFVLNFTTAVRYVVPALPFLAVLAAGNLRAPSRVLRSALGALLAAWCAVELVWGWRVYALRRSPAPVWSCLEWVADRYEPNRTTVVYHGLFAPLAEWVLGRRGFEIRVAEPGTTYDASLRPQGDVVLVYSRAVPGTQVVRAASWNSGRLRRLTRDRYYACTAATAAPAAGPVFSTDFQVREANWELWDVGVVRLGADRPPAVLCVEPLDGPLFVGGARAPGRRVEAGERVEIVLLPGPGGEVVIRTPRQRHVHLAPLRVETLAPSSSALASGFVVPGLVRGAGDGGGGAASDLLLVNPHDAPVLLSVRLLPGAGGPAGGGPVHVPLPPGTLTVVDVLAHPALGAAAMEGALVLQSVPSVEAAGRPFFVAGRTTVAGAGAPGGGARWLRGLPLIDGIGHGGTARLRGLTSDAEWRERSGAVSSCRRPVELRWTFLAADGRKLGELRQVVQPDAQSTFDAPGAGRDVDAVVTVAAAPSGCLVFPFAILQRRQTGEVTLLPADPEPSRR